MRNFFSRTCAMHERLETITAHSRWDNEKFQWIYWFYSRPVAHSATSSILYIISLEHSCCCCCPYGIAIATTAAAVHTLAVSTISSSAAPPLLLQRCCCCPWWEFIKTLAITMQCCPCPYTCMLPLWSAAVLLFIEYRIKKVRVRA